MKLCCTPSHPTAYVIPLLTSSHLTDTASTPKQQCGCQVSQLRHRPLVRCIQVGRANRRASSASLDLIANAHPTLPSRSGSFSAKHMQKSCPLAIPNCPLHLPITHCPFKDRVDITLPWRPHENGWCLATPTVYAWPRVMTGFLPCIQQDTRGYYICSSFSYCLSAAISFQAASLLL